MVRHYPDALTGQACKAADDVLGVVLLNFCERPCVTDLVHHLADVVRLLRALRYDHIQCGPLFIARRVIQGFRVLLAVLWKKTQNAFDVLDHTSLIGRREMGNPGLARVGFGPAQLFACHLLVCDRFDHVGAGHEHVAGALGHENEIRQSWRIHRPARTRTEDGTQLWNHPTGAHVAVKNIRIAPERYHTLLDARPTAVVQANEGSAVLHCQVHDAADFLGVRLGK